MAIQLSGSLQLTGSLFVDGDPVVLANQTSSLSVSSASFASTASYADAFTVAGEIVAQTLNVQQVTSSVVYSSGSNVFGNSVSNTQQFTGSLQVSGSTHYLLGNVGIGSTSSNYPLYIKKDSGNYEIVTIQNDTSAALFRAIGNGGGSVDFGAEVNTASTAIIRTASTERVRVTADGNVGIGTNSPTGTYGKLTVNGSISLLDDQNTKLEIGRYSAGAPNSYIKLGANSNSLRITNNTDLADLLYLTNDGNLGLGVAPSAWGAAFKVIQIGRTSLYEESSIASKFSNNVYFSDANRYYANGEASQYTQYLGSHIWTIASSGTAGNAISFTQAMTLNASGNLSIGNTNDTYKLDVSGTGIFRGALTVRNDQGTGVDAQLRLRGTNSTARTTRLQFEDYNGTLADGIIDFKIPTAGVASSATLSIGINSPNLTFVSTGAATFSSDVVLNNGKFLQAARTTGGAIIDLIGIQSGTDTLQIKGGTSGATNSINFYDTGGLIATFYAGRLGIGTTSPTNKLHVNSQDDNTYALRVQGNTNNVAGVWTGIGISGEDANTKAAIIFEDIGQSYSRGKLHFAINNETNQNNATPANARLTITQDGYVGINNTGPLYKFDVREVTTDPIAYFGYSQTSSASNGLIKLNSGRIPQFGSDYSGESGIIFGHSGGTGGVNFDGQGGYIKSIRLNTYATGTEADSALIFATSLDNADTEKMRITSEGYVGISTGDTDISSGDLIGVLAFNSKDGSTNSSGAIGSIRSYATADFNTGNVSGDLRFYTQDTGTPNGSLLSGAERMRITPTGGLAIGTTTASGTYRLRAINSDAVQGDPLFAADNAVYNAILVYSVGADGYNGAAAGIVTGKNTSTNRSINAGGTINASGSDYAEYITKAIDDIIAKGDIVGINNQAKLTNIFADAISFVVKSTDPSYVGGDAWFNNEKRPQKTEEQTQEEFDEIMQDFEFRLEAERAKVDRIAFSGQVPCNVYDAQVGDYIIPIETEDGKIAGQPVSNPTFEQYTKAVGKVWKIMEDGRAWISVKIG